MTAGHLAIIRDSCRFKQFQRIRIMHTLIESAPGRWMERRSERSRIVLSDNHMNTNCKFY